MSFHMKLAGHVNGNGLLCMLNHGCAQLARVLEAILYTTGASACWFWQALPETFVFTAHMASPGSSW